MSETMGEAGWHFVFEINEDDDRIFKKMAARDARRYVGRPIIPIVCAGLCGALIIAMLWGVLSLGAVLTGEASFAVGYLSLIIATFTAAPRMQKALFKETSDANRRFDCVFGIDEIVIKIGLRETRLPWGAIWRVEDTPDMVIFWYQPTQGFFAPNRAFSNGTARIAFATWATARVQAASNAGVSAPV